MEKYKSATQEEIDRRRAFYTGEKRSVGLTNTQAWNQIFGWGDVMSGVSADRAQKLSVVYTCLNVLGETVGSLPFDVKQYTKEGRVSAPGNPVYRLLHDRPNPHTTAFDFWSTAEKLKKAWGNFFAEIQRDAMGTPIALWSLPPWEVEIICTEDNGMYYRYKGRNIRSTDILHFKNYSLDGVTGISTIKQNALSISMGLKLKEYNSKVIGERPYGYLTTESKPKDLNAKMNQQGLWNKRSEVNPNVASESIISDSANVAGMQLPILYGGVEFKQLSLPADDVAYIESTNLTNKDIYGIFRVPPTFGQDWENTPYNGAEQQDIVFAKYTLASLREMEQECTEKLFPESNKKATNAFYAKFNLKGILAGDTAARREFYAAMFNIAVLNANEIREMEDMTTYKGGEEYYIQGALVPVSKIADFIDSKIQASKNKGQSKAATKAEVKKMLRAEAKEKLNGHFKDVAEIFD